MFTFCANDDIILFIKEFGQKLENAGTMNVIKFQPAGVSLYVDKSWTIFYCIFSFIMNLAFLGFFFILYNNYNTVTLSISKLNGRKFSNYTLFVCTRTEAKTCPIDNFRDRGITVKNSGFSEHHSCV